LHGAVSASGVCLTLVDPMRTRHLGFLICASIALQLWSARASADIPAPPKVAFTCNDAGKVAYSGTCQAGGPTPTSYCPSGPTVLFGCPAPDAGVPTGQVEQINEFDAGCTQGDSGGWRCLRGIEGTIDASCCQVQGYPSLCFDSPECVAYTYGPKVFCAATPSLECQSQEAGDSDAGCDASVTCTPPVATPPASDSGGGCNLTTTNAAGGLSLLMFIGLLWTLAFRRR
jgi:hypothetical protein